MKYTLALPLAICAWANSAQATPITYTATTGVFFGDVDSSIVPPPPIPGFDPLELSLFDSNLGVLTSVDLTIEATLSADGVAAPAGAAPSGSYAIDLEVDVAVTPNLPGIAPQTLQMMERSTSFSFGPGETDPKQFTINTSGKTVGALSAAAFQVAGGGKVTLDYARQITATTDGGTPLAINLAGAGDITVTLTYVFDPAPVPPPTTAPTAAVPLPAGGILLMAAIGALAGARRKQRALT